MINEYWLIAAAIAAVAVYTAAALKKKTPYDRIVLYVIFILYMAGLIGVTMFPVIFDHSLMGAMDEPMYRIKLIPFEIIMEELNKINNNGLMSLTDEFKIEKYKFSNSRK